MDCIKDLQTFVLNYLTIIVKYSVTGDISLTGDSGDLCNRTTQHSSRKAIRSVIEKKKILWKSQIMQDQFENKTSILDRETDSNFPRNFK